MSEDNEAMQVESNYYQPLIGPNPHSCPEKKEHLQSNSNTSVQEEKEPLFVIDRTRNLKLQYEVIMLFVIISYLILILIIILFLIN